MKSKSNTIKDIRFPLYGWVGLFLILVCWPLNWLLPGLRTHLLFFPLWLGYILTVNGLLYVRTKSSPFSRSPRLFAGMFVLSAPVWWIFELFNYRIQNWHYLGRENFSDLEYFLLGTLNFSTVIPAVFATAELFRSFKWLGRFQNGPRINATKGNSVLFFILGFGMLALILTWPVYFYALIWPSLFFILEPINHRLGRRTILAETGRRDWRTVAALFAGTLACGFFWEMWNYFSYPKWIYHTPFVDFLHIFEMPLLGYLGYLPFGLELFALAHFFLPKNVDLRI